MSDVLGTAPRGLFNGWWPIYDYSTLCSWMRDGAAVSMGNDYDMLVAQFDHRDCIIRVHAVTTLKQYFGLIDAYRALRRAYSSPGLESVCLFRGQSRDYYSDGSQVLLAPPPVAFRSNELAHQYLSLLRDTELHAQWRQWAQVLRVVLALEDATGPLYRLRDPEQPDRKTALPRDQTMASRLSTNLSLMVLAMHYGFPTATLDVTPDPAVALWFSQHAMQRVEDSQLIRYVTPDPVLQGTPAGPSIYVYLQLLDWENYLAVDLTSIPGLRGKADRPFAQSAWGLPFHSMAQAWHGDMDSQFFRVSTPTRRYPSAIIKPYLSVAELQKARALHEVAELFPPADPLYCALLDANAPRLARYAYD